MGLDYRVRCCPDGLMTDRRHNVRVLDCTIRDGGICNQWAFSREWVKETFEALVKSGVDIMEIGYQTTPGVFDRATHGPWRFCDEADLKAVARKTNMKLSCMVDVGRIRVEDLRPADKSLVDVIRVACYAHQIEDAIILAHAAQDLGYEVFCNVMAVTTCTPQEVDHFLEALRNSRVPNIAVVDSFGALYPHQLRYLVRKYKNWLRPDQKVGVHLHNNQEQAFANSIAAIDEGADFVDASLFGMGRGAGNCPLELLMLYLDDSDHNVLPLFALIDKYAALRDELKWGYQAPYAITGWHNLHPRSAIDRLQHHGSKKCDEFFTQLNANAPRHHAVTKEP